MKRATLSAFILLFAAVGRAEKNDSPYPLFHADVVVHASSQNLAVGRIDIYAEVVYDDIQFLKTDTAFVGSYEMTAIILDGADQIDGRSWKQTISVPTFDLTNSRREVDVTHQSFDIDPGKYTVRLGFEDLESGRTYTSEQKVQVDDFSIPPLSGSEITFARRIDIQDGRIVSLFPEVTTPYKGLGFPAFAYFEVYYPQKSEQPPQGGAPAAEISYQISGESTKLKMTNSFQATLTGDRTTFSIPLPTDSLSHDRYQLTIGITVDNKRAELNKTFYVRWAGLPRNAGDLETAIRQAQLIASAKEWKKLKKAPEDKKLQIFREFWAGRDPSPGSEQNETMQSYYAKVDAANQSFTVMGREGWQTDRGLVFIILGPPDEIIRNEYPSASRPYQIWQYYSINRQFEFFDRNGFGDYELLYPVSIYELQRYAGLMN